VPYALCGAVTAQAKRAEIREKRESRGESREGKVRREVEREKRGRGVEER
jgi:hypothetical protein